MGARAERMGRRTGIVGGERMIDAKRLLSDCQALVRELEADLRDQLDQRSDLQAALNARASRGDGREAHTKIGRGVDGGADHAGGCCLGARLRFRALPRGQRARRHAPPLRDGRSASAGARRGRPTTSASILSARRASTSRTRSAQSLRSQGAPASSTSGTIRSGNCRSAATPRAICSSAGGRSTRRAARSSTTSPIRRGRRASSATSTRISPRPPASSTRCCRPRSSSRSSSSTARSSRRSTSSASRRHTHRPGLRLRPLPARRVHRLLGHWREREPGEDVRVHVERVLAAVGGVDLNPFAAAIARFRLLVAALRPAASGSYGMRPTSRSSRRRRLAPAHTAARPSRCRVGGNP